MHRYRLNPPLLVDVDLLLHSIWLFDHHHHQPILPHHHDQIMIKSWSKISSTSARSSFGLGQSSNAGPTVQSAVGTYCSGIWLLKRCFNDCSGFIKTKKDHWHLTGVTTLNPPTAFSGVGEGDYIEIANLQPGAHSYTTILWHMIDDHWSYTCQPPTRCWNISML